MEGCSNIAVQVRKAGGWEFISVFRINKSMLASKDWLVLPIESVFTHAVINICNSDEFDLVQKVKELKFRMVWTEVGFVLRGAGEQEQVLLRLLAKKVNSVFMVNV